MANHGGQPDRKQLGGFFDAVFRIKFDDNTKVIAPQCLRQVTPGVSCIKVYYEFNNS